MTPRMRLVVGALFMACGVVAIARATPTFGLILDNILSTGSTTRGTVENAQVELGTPGAPEPKDPEDDDWSANFSTSGASDFTALQLGYAPGGHSGWHSTSGIVLTTVVSGSIEWYDEKCVLHVYNAGDSFTEDTRSHYLRNVGTVNAQYTSTFIVPHGHALRIDEPAPECAAALGLE
jgi:quercetin dioxygenase-like cupin family protein